MAISFGAFMFSGTFLAGMAGTVVAGAIIGAGIGALSTLVLGGDLGKNMLYGAVGGAVLGGVQGLMPSSQFLAAGSTPYTTGGNVVFQGAGESGTFIAKSGVESAIGGAGMSTSDGVAEGGIGLIGSVLGGLGESGQAKDQMKFQKEQAAINLKAEQEALDKKLAAQAELQPEDHFGEQLAWEKEKHGTDTETNRSQFASEMAERRRQFDQPIAQAETERKRAGSVLANARFARKGAGRPNVKSIRQGVTEDAAKYVPDAEQIA